MARSEEARPTKAGFFVENGYIRTMEEELSTQMHAEFFSDEYTKEEWAAMGVFGALRRGVSLEDALAQYGLTESRYKELCLILSL